jgi:RES domain-containing protein
VIWLPWESGQFHIWRVDADEFSEEWDKGMGSQLRGGRWNPIGYPAVYCSADPATAILETAVHQGFKKLDSEPHVLTRAIVLNHEHVHVVRPGNVPNPLWLFPVPFSRGQQEFGRNLLEEHPFVLVPSAVTGESWNLVFNPGRARDRYRLEQQKPFALDTRLNPPRPTDEDV